MKLEFGYKCKDIVTGFEGILKTRGMFITGCDRVVLVNGNKKDDEQWFDTPIIKVIDEGVYKDLQKTQSNKYDDIDNALYDFGIKVKDKITEFEGIIIGKAISISGDISYGISPKYDKNVKDNNAGWFDEERIIIVGTKKEKINTDKERPGGAVPSLKIR
jgi:hypothetical protein